MGQYVTRTYLYLGYHLTEQRVKQLRGESETELRRERAYAASLREEKAKLDERLEENKCPSGQLDEYMILGFVSKGGSAQVFQVYNSEKDEDYALKVQKKKRFKEKRLLKGLFMEKKLGYAARCVFIANINAAFQDNFNLYMVMDFAQYGTIRQLMRMPPERIVKFYTAQIILGIEYLHACRIIHRDLKPANIFLFSDLYLKIGDLGLAVKVEERCFNSAGTPMYMAPETELMVGYGTGADWWSLGIILYEFMYMQHPFCNPKMSIADVKKAMRSKSLTYPDWLPSSQAQLFDAVNYLIEGLLERTVYLRLGARKGGAEEVKKQKWFRDISFIDILEKKVAPMIDHDDVTPVKATEQLTYPFIEDKEGEFDNSQFEGF